MIRLGIINQRIIIIIQKIIVLQIAVQIGFGVTIGSIGSGTIVIGGTGIGILGFSFMIFISLGTLTPISRVELKPSQDATKH